MDRLERFYKIDHLLQGGHAVPFQKLKAELEVHSSTLKRDLEYMRSRFNAPIEWDRGEKGYRLVEQTRPGPKYQLPGLWFNASEAYALLAMQQLLANLEPGLLNQQVKPIEKRLHAILNRSKLSKRDIQRRIRILHIASRRHELNHFEVVASAVLQRRRLHIHYFVRTRSELTKRDVSPQRLVHYRDNWYLDAWCHSRNRVQTFSLDAIQNASLLKDRCKHVDENELDEILASGYGIFSGKDTTNAVLRFTPERARWVSSEVWHPKQKGYMEVDGKYRLEFPYSDDRELVGDILRFGSEVEVLDPPSLKNRVAGQLKAALTQYPDA